METLLPTKYLEDFLRYYRKAEFLQNQNLVALTNPNYQKQSVDDPLMDLVHIYDTVERRHAGFSKILQDLFGFRPDRCHEYWSQEFRKYPNDVKAYICLLHRITGSGASFEKDHGYRNTVVFDIVASCNTIEQIQEFLTSIDKSEKPRAIFTSIGNQIPPFPKPQPPFVRGGFMYLVHYAPYLARDFFYEVSKPRETKMTIREGVEFCCAWHKKYGLKQFHFVLTAWVMDFADYWPELVDPWSICDYGKNAIETLNLLFSTTSKRKSLSKKEMDSAIMYLSQTLNAKPMDLEDVLCDYVRYIENYIPDEGRGDYKDYIGHVWNNSQIKDHPKGRQRHATQ